ncbi:MAG: RNA pseudouridine synthase [Prevotella sp.]|nr:RNA pseudouridine synthase [Prevotella sp.]
MKVLYEDNHLIVVHKESGEIVQGDKTGDTPLSESVKDYLKAEHDKPGNVFLGVAHRLDRPVAGVVVFAKTSKALARLNDMFRQGKVDKTYWAVTQGAPEESQAVVEGWLTRNEKQNKSYVHDREKPGAKKAVLTYKVLAKTPRYALLEVKLLTGRHHQIRCQLAALGHPIKGDLKYGAKRSNPDGSISLLARKVEFEHPVSHLKVSVTAPVPDDNLWHDLEREVDAAALAQHATEE